MNGAVTLSVGDMHQPRFGKNRIIFAGMPSESVFSMIEIKWEFVYRGYAWNLFFPATQRQIRIDGVNYEVLRVGPDDITLRG